MPRNTIHTLDNTGGTVQDWFESIPFVTRWWFFSAFLVTCAGNMGLVPPTKLVYSWELIWGNVELSKWTLITFYNLAAFGWRHEEAPYNTGAGGRTPDYAFTVLFGAASIILTNPLMDLIPCDFLHSSTIFAETLVYFVIYSWSKRQPNALVLFWVVTTIQLKAIQLPFAQLLLNIAVGGSVSSLLHGIAVGHLYFYLVDVVPIVYGKDILHTPQFLIDHLRGCGRESTGGYTMHRPRSRVSTDKPCRAEAHSWGGGQALGSY
ncbi:hypothetical protein ACHAXT_001864 [Thalassiosira profunda]